MFEKLVVSSVQRRRGRTTKFFLGTVAVYASAVAIAFALSIALAAPKLADSELAPICRLVSPPAAAPPDSGVAADHHDSGGASRQTLDNLQKFEQLMARPQTGAMRPFMPGGTNIGERDGVQGGDPNAPPGSIGPIGGEPRTNEPPPRPPDPPKPPAPTAEPDKRPMRVASVVLQGKAVERRTPIYPPLARQIRLQGEASVEVIISPDGRVENARVVSGHPMFAQCAKEAALGWRFEPTFLNGVRVRVTGVITFVFKLND